MSYSQRETPILAELCTYLVEDVYGELAARVFSVLARYGRQSLSDLVRASYLNGRQVKYGLVILLQQHLVFHSPNDAPLSYYEIDWQQSYALVRCGKIAKLVEDRFGKKAANVISNLVTLGHTRIADLREAYFPPDTDSGDESDGGIVNGLGLKRKRANGTRVNGTTTNLNGVVNGTHAEPDDAKPATEALLNGASSSKSASKSAKPNGTSNGAVEGSSKETAEDQDDDSIDSEEELYKTIHLLMQQGWVMTVVEAQYYSPADLHHMAQQQILDERHGGLMPPAAKMKNEVAMLTQRRKRDIRDAWLEVPELSTQKRKTGDSNHGTSNKRIKVNGTNEWSGSAHGHGANIRDASSLDNLVIRVNPEKIAVAMRTELLVHLVEERLGSLTARIYEIMLHKLESNIQRCREEYPDPLPTNPEDVLEDSIDANLLITAREVEKRAKDLEISDGLDPNTVVHTTKKGHVRSSGMLSYPVNPVRLSSDERVKIVDKHIQRLSEDPFHFVTWHSRAGYSQWHIEFEEIMKAIIQQEIEKTILSRKGALGVKLLRALMKKGKLDERQTCNTMLMSPNDIRGIINDLTIQGFIQTQEIPRVERREAKHSIHLIWYDRQRAREKLLHDTYQGMIRILQRISYEREQIQPLLTKAERSDVVGNEAKYLSKGELGALKKWKHIQEQLLLQLFREDDLVAMLRDFMGPLISA